MTGLTPRAISRNVFTTNLIYRSPELLQREWYQQVDMSKYIAYIIDYLNHDQSISPLLDPVEKINRLLEKAKTANRYNLRLYLKKACPDGQAFFCLFGKRGVFGDALSRCQCRDHRPVGERRLGMGDAHFP